MTVPAAAHKRSRTSLTCPQKFTRRRAQDRHAAVIVRPDPRSASKQQSSPAISQCRPALHRPRKKARLSADGTGVSQAQLLVTSLAKPVFPTTSSSAFSSPPHSGPQPNEEDNHSVTSERLRLKMTNTSSTATHGKLPTGQVCTYEDWQDIKELFAKAAEQYNGKLIPNASQLMCSPSPLRPTWTLTRSATKKYSPRDGCGRGDATASSSDSRVP